MIRLSLVIATYNRAASLLDTLKSVVRQNAPVEQWECVVVNNNSSDNTAECFAEFVREYPDYNIRMVNEPSQGLSYARNRGIREGVGEYIAIIDDDEHIAEDFIASYIELFDSVPEAVAAGGPIVAPSCRSFLLTPLAPHNLTMRPIVMPDSSIVSLRINTRNNEALISADNRTFKIANDTLLTIKKAERYIRLAVPHNISFFDSLRNKMMWGVDIR